MAKGIVKRVTEFLEGDREPGENAPADDSHVKGPKASFEGNMDDQELEQAPIVDAEQEYQLEIAGTLRKVDQATYDMVMADRAQHRSVQAPAPAPVPEPEPIFDPTDFYNDPEAALRAVENRAVERATKITQSTHSADKAQNDFWNAFYGENKKLVGEERLVKMMLAENMESLQNLKGKSGRDELAKFAETEILRISNKHRGKAQPNQTSRLEGGNVTGLTTQESDRSATNDALPAARPPSIGDAIKERKLQRDRAKRGETQLS